MFRKFILTLPLALAAAGCVQNQGALTGAALGSAAGVAVSGDDDRVTGALVGGAVGAAAGNYIGKTSSGTCVYERSNGARYYAACP